MLGYLFSRRHKSRAVGTTLKGAYIGGIVGAVFGRTQDNRKNKPGRRERYY
jgi:hypothetical protein